MRRFCFSLMSICFFMAACGLMDHREEKAVITVGKKHIGAEELKEEIRRLAFEMGIPDPGADNVKEALVGRIVDQCLVLEYGREKGISVPKEEVESAVKEIIRDYGQKNFREMLLERYIDFEAWKARLKRRILLNKITRTVSQNLAPVPIQEIKAYFDSHRDEFRHPPMVKFRQIVLKTRKEAEEVLKRLEQGEDMGELAGESSLTPDMDATDETGWIAEGNMEKSMEKAIFSTPPGKTSDVVKSSYGFHIFEVLAQRPEGTKSLPEAMGEIEAKLNYDRESLFYEEWLKGLRASIPVKVNQELVTSMEIG